MYRFIDAMQDLVHGIQQSAKCAAYVRACISGIPKGMYIFADGMHGLQRMYTLFHNMHTQLAKMCTQFAKMYTLFRSMAMYLYKMYPYPVK